MDEYQEINERKHMLIRPRHRADSIIRNLDRDLKSNFPHLEIQTDHTHISNGRILEVGFSSKGNILEGKMKYKYYFGHAGDSDGGNHTLESSFTYCPPIENSQEYEQLKKLINKK
ncbi:hypothetical protein HN953_03780, partial [Candidatus Woesearchaeota archaeon]|nr:hypothetical protein [Candidatus Woesearchaeota archaeon]